MWLSGAWQRIRRASSRDQWAVRLLRLPFSSEAPGQPGLVLIQIDGLSRFQFERAMRRRRLPFLRRLLRRKKYRVTTLYSGLPSATPMVQGELFYGVPCAVPSFQYRDGQTGHAVRMFDPTPAAKVQARLSLSGRRTAPQRQRLLRHLLRRREGSPLLPLGVGLRNVVAGGSSLPLRRVSAPLPRRRHPRRRHDVGRTGAGRGRLRRADLSPAGTCGRSWDWCLRASQSACSCGS